MNNTVIYCRTANCDMEIIERQLEVLNRYVQKTGYVYSAVYCDCNESGATLDRPNMLKLLNDIRAGEVKRIIVKDLSRLARSHYHFYKLINIFYEYGVELISVNDGGFVDIEWAKKSFDTLLAFDTINKVEITAKHQRQYETV